MFDSKEYFECSCWSPEHLIMVETNASESEVIITTQLSHHLPWYKRIIPAIKYVFGMDYDCAGWGETVLNYSQAARLHQMLTEFDEAIEKMGE